MTVTLNNNYNEENNKEDISVQKESEIKLLIEKNVELSNEILKLSKKTHSILMWQNIFGFLKVLLILIPLIIGFLYLPPLLEQLMQSYKEILGINETANSFGDNIKNAPKELLDNFRK